MSSTSGESAVPVPTHGSQSPGTPVLAPPADAEHAGIVQLFGLLAAGELQAFYRLSSEALLAPDTAGRVHMAAMASAEMRHFQTLEQALVERGRDVVATIDEFAPVVERYHQTTVPRNWAEALIKVYVGDGLAADFYAEIAGVLPPPVQGLVREVTAETSHSEFAVGAIRDIVAARPRERSALTLWGRRLLGEAITQAQHVLASRDELTDLLFDSAGGLGQIADFFDSIQQRHTARLANLNLG